jgi:hypothetical protein
VPIPSVRAAPRLSLIDPLDPSAQLLPGWSSLAPTAGRDVRGERAAGRGAVAAVLAAQGGPTSPRLLECLRSPTLPRPGWLRCPARRRHRSALPRPAVVGVGDFLASLSSSFCTSPPRCRRRRGLPRFLVVIILHFPALLSSASGTSSLARCRHHSLLPRPAVVSVGVFLSRCRHHLALPRPVVVSVGDFLASPRRLRIVPSVIRFCFQRHLLRPPLSPVLPTMRFGVGLSPGDSRPGPGGLCSMRPPPAGRADLDVDANYTALTPRPRLSSPSGAHPIAFTEHHSPPVCRSSRVSAGYRPGTTKSPNAPPPPSRATGYDTTSPVLSFDPEAQT